MKQLSNAILLFAVMAFIASCGSGKKEREGALGDKKVELQKLKDQESKLEEQILALETEIAKLDTSAVVPQKPKLVALATVTPGQFKNFLELQGKVDAQNISYISPSGPGGQIKAIYVKQGDHVRKGQLVLKLDNSVAMQNVNAVRQQMSSVKAQLDLARSVYTRQKNLWDQHIGTEVQLLQAKTNVETLEGQLKAIAANVSAAQEQANQANVYSNVNGTVDEVTAHVGESFTGNPAAGGFIKVVNNTDLKITVNVPENYASRISKGTPVNITIPDLNKSFKGTISFISQAIGTVSRGFVAEVKVPAGMNLRPNQIAKVFIQEYTAPEAISVPLNTIQNDEKGKYVLVAEKKGDVMVASKRHIVIGVLNKDSIEVKQGLQKGDQLIVEGFQGLFEGQPVTTTND